MDQRPQPKTKPKAEDKNDEHSSSPLITPKRPKRPPNFQKMLDSRGTTPQKALTDRLARAKTQRMVILHHHVSEASWGPVITFKIAGSVGDVYTTVVKEFPSCDCQDFTYRRQSCKHVLYALVHACSVPEDVALKRKFSKPELAQMIGSSALARVDRAVAHAAPGAAPGARKPIEGECAICFMEMNQSQKTVWCKHRCGNNLHESCFNQWAATCSDAVTCVYCRAPWGEQDADAKLGSILAAGVPAGQYINVASQLGMSNQHDRSISRTSPPVPPEARRLSPLPRSPRGFD